MKYVGRALHRVMVSSYILLATVVLVGLVPWRLAAQELAWNKTLNVPVASVSSLAFFPDGKILAVASVDKTVKLWDVKTGKNLDTLTGHSVIVASLLYCQLTPELSPQEVRRQAILLRTAANITLMPAYAGSHTKTN